SQPFLTAAVVVLPGVVEEAHAGIERLVGEPVGFVHARQIAQVMAADADGGDVNPGLAERSPRDLEGRRPGGACRWRGAGRAPAEPDCRAEPAYGTRARPTRPSPGPVPHPLPPL